MSRFLEKAAAALKARPLPVPELDETVYIRALTEVDSEAVRAACVKEGTTEVDSDAFMAAMIGVCTVDENGDRVFPEDNDARIRTMIPNTVYQRIANAVLEANRPASTEKN